MSGLCKRQVRGTERKNREKQNLSFHDPLETHFDQVQYFCHGKKRRTLLSPHFYGFCRFLSLSSLLMLKSEGTFTLFSLIFLPFSEKRVRDDMQQAV
jgi:hypothetical protein